MLTTRQMLTTRSLLGLISCFMLIASGARAAEMTPGVTPADIDVAQSGSFINGKPLDPAPADALPVLLGAAPVQGQMPEWKAGPVLGTIIDFRVAFKQAVEIGTIVTSFRAGRNPGGPLPRTGQSVCYLKPEAALPGDVTKEDDWVTLPPGSIKTLPPGVTTRALRFHDRVAEWGYGAGGDRAVSSFPYSILFKERYYNALNLGHASKSGKQNTPEVWMAYWPQPQTVVGMIMMPLRAAAEVEYLKPDAADHPILAGPTEWRKTTAATVSPGATIYSFAEPIPTKAIRMTAGAWRQDSNFPQVIPLINLGQNPDVPGVAFPPPPFSIKYNMPMDGFVALNVYDKKTGKRVRQLIAEVARDKGPVDEPWDLRDAKGAPVPPGDYEFKAIARPPFKLTYELTPYNAGQPPWWAPTPGKGGGGWMADHTPPYSATSCGDMVFLSSTYNESGSGVIAVDHQGNKVWGEAYITGFEIANRLASDGHKVFAMNNEVVQQIDPAKDFDSREIYHFEYTRELPATPRDPTQGGLAARDGKLYVAFSGPPVSWLQTSFLCDALDPEKSFPRAWLEKGSGSRQASNSNDKNYNDANYDELMAFYEAFLTGSTPAQTRTWPSTFLPSSTQAYFGDAPKQGPMVGQLVAAFHEPVTVGSILLPDRNIKVWALKPGAPMPSEDPGGAGNDPDAALGNDTGGGGGLNDDDWIALDQAGKPGQPSIALAPAGGLKTRALRFKADRVSFAMVMNRRFDDLAPSADRTATEGNWTPGGWMLDRPATKPLNQFNSAATVLVWKQPVTLRGISLVRPNAGIMAVDVYTGPATGDPAAAVEDDKQWKEMGRIEPQIFNGWYGQTPTLRNIDFGDLVEVRAVRIRALASPGARSDLVGGPWPAGTPVVGAIVAEHYLGGDPEGIPQEMNGRIDELQLPTDSKAMATFIRHIPFKKPGNLVFGKDGALYAVSDAKIVTVPLDDSAKSRVVVPGDQLEQPAALAMDAEGLLYVSDLGPQVVKVFDSATGKLVRTIGKPGAHKPGPWDENCMDSPTGIAIDSAGKLWITHNSYQPKRVSRWTLDGKCEANFLGPTAYGGGGTLDSGDKNTINYNGMEFKIDWQKMDWKLNGILFRPGKDMSMWAAMPDHPVYFQGRRYLVGNGTGGWTPAPSVICIEKNGIAVPVAAAGNLGNCKDLADHPDLLKAFGALDRQKYSFVWYDKNGDGVMQADEVQIAEDKWPGSTGSVGEDLSFNFGGYRLRPTGFLPNGVPTYDMNALEKLPLMSERAWALPDGRTFTMVDQWNRMLTPDGKTIKWDYYDQFGVFAGFYTANFGYDRPPGVLSAEQSIFGHLNGPGNEEYWITSSDQGDWFCFTGDGFLVGCIFGGPTGYGLRRWTMPDWTPGKVDLSDLRLLQECYQGDVVRCEDGTVYAVAGKNHMSIVKVEGLEQLQRMQGDFVVAPDDIQKQLAWANRKAMQEQVQEEAKIAKAPYVNQPFNIDGALDDWPYDLFFTVNEWHKTGFHVDEEVTDAQAAVAYDDTNLYVAAKVLDGSPMMNGADDLKTLFKHGDALDIQLQLDPNADPKRTGAMPGDVRILVTRVKGQDIAMLYRYKDPAAPVDQHVKFTSPVDSIDIDSITQLTDAKIGIQVQAAGVAADQMGWTMEIAIPWKSLGVGPPKIGGMMRGDIGVLRSDQNGVQTVDRQYWSGKSQKVTADLPSEARLAPNLWGQFYFTEPSTGMKFGPDAGPDLGGDLAP